MMLVVPGRFRCSAGKSKWTNSCSWSTRRHLTALAYFDSNSSAHRSSLSAAWSRVSAYINLVHQPFGSRLKPFGQLVQHLRDLVAPAARRSRFGPYASNRRPEPPAHGRRSPRAAPPCLGASARAAASPTSECSSRTPGRNLGLQALQKRAEGFRAPCPAWTMPVGCLFARPPIRGRPAPAAL